MNFQVFEPDLFMEFFNTEVIKSRRDEEETLSALVLADWPWLIAYYWSKKQIIVGQNSAMPKKSRALLLTKYGSNVQENYPCS